MALIMSKVSLSQYEDSDTRAAVSSDQLKEKRGLVYEAKSKTPYTGLSRTNYPGGQKKKVTSWVNGKKEGPRTWWYETGQREIVTSYANGLPDGPQTRWHENGQKRVESYFVNHKNEGPVTWWYENGRKEFEGNFVNGKEKRGSKWWDENGNKKKPDKRPESGVVW